METVTDQEVINRLITSEAGQKAAASVLRDRTTARMDLKARAEKLRRERGKQARELADGVEVTRKRVEQARKILTEAEQEHRVAVMQQQQTAAHFSTRIGKLERELRATAPAAITEFLGWLEDMEIEVKATPIVENATKTNKINTHTHECVKQHFSNAKSLDVRLKAIRVARAEAEALRDKILDDDDLQQRLDALRELPPVSMQFAYEK